MREWKILVHMTNLINMFVCCERLVQYSVWYRYDYFLYSMSQTKEFVLAKMFSIRMYDSSSNDTSSTEPFRRKSFLSKCHFIECPLCRIIFRRILSTKYFVPTWPPYCICLSCDYGVYGCETTDLGGHRHST